MIDGSQADDKMKETTKINKSIYIYIFFAYLSVCLQKTSKTAEQGPNFVWDLT